MICGICVLNAWQTTILKQGLLLFRQNNIAKNNINFVIVKNKKMTLRRGGDTVKKKYVSPVVEKYGDLETIILSGKSKSSCKTDCR